MRPSQPVVLSFVFALFCAILSARAQESSVTELTAELLEMGRKDQEVRERIGAAFQQAPAEFLRNPPPEFVALTTEMKQIDTANLKRLEEIISKHGWPGSRMVGSQASGAAWVILQHAPLESQERYLPVLQKAAALGDVRPDQVAMLEDRVLVGQGKKQRYGTQIVSNASGDPEVAPVENPSQLAALRKSVGLPPMDEYLRHGEAELGRPIGRGNLLPPGSQ